MFKRPSLGMPRFTVGTFFGELALIVIGVLLALSVDEWRQSRARDVAAAEAVLSIRAELASNRELAVAALEYHGGRLAHIGQALGSGTPLAPEDFPDGYTNPARFVTGAWETAREAGELGAVDRDLRLHMATSYAAQARYGKQIDSMSSLIYGTLYKGGMRGMVENPQGLMMLIGSFSYREREIVGVFDETLAAIDAQ